MKFVVSKTSLEVCVKNLCRVINTKNALPILGDILCMVDQDQKKITMTASDGEMWLHYQVELTECEGGGPFCIGADIFKASLEDLGDQPLTIYATTESDMVFRIVHETGETILPMESSEEYPKPKWVGNTATEWKLDCGMLKRTLKRTLFATAIDELRPQMTGIYFDRTDGMLNIVATNGHMLIRNEEDDDNLDGSFIMPKKVAKILPELIGGIDDVDVLFDERITSFACGNMTLVFLDIEGNYPNYRSVIPEDAPYEFEVDRLELLKALRNVAHFTDNSSRMVTLHISSNQALTLFGYNTDFMMKASDAIDIGYTSDKDMNIGVKADSLIEFLTKIVEKDIIVHFTNPSSAITINPQEPFYEGENITALIMPMLINE